MDTRRQVVLLAIALLAGALGPAPVEAQVDQSALAQRLLGGNAGERSRALEAARALGPANTGPELRAALIALLERNNRIVAEAAKRNEAVANLESPEFIAHVAHAVSQLQDPGAIPALAGGLGITGSTLVTDALADFGELAAPAVLRVVTPAESRDDAVEEALITLRFMVEGAGTPPLSTGTLNEIRRVTERRLTGKQYFTVLWSAIDLAIALKDPALRRIVESLASDRNEVVARGIGDPDLIQRTQRLAAEGLAGVPRRPHYRSHAERARLFDPLGPR